MRAPVWLLCVAAAVGCLALVRWAFVATTVPPQAGDRKEQLFSDPEEWAKAVSRTGEGEMRFAPAAGSDSTDSAGASSGGEAPVVTVRSLGPLSSASLEALTGSLARQIDQTHKLLGESGLGMSSPVKDLKALVDMTTKMAVLERVAAGDYWTLPQEAETPPIPSGCGSMQIDPHRLPNGEVVKVLVIFDAAKVSGLKGMIQALHSAKQADREQRLRDWNAQSDEIRSEAIQRHVQLRIKAGDNPRAQMSSGEFADYWRMELLLDSLGADVVPGRTVLFPR